MNEDLLIGLAAIGAPMLVLGFVFLRRNLPIFGFFVALLLAGLGYLWSTDALSDVGRLVQSQFQTVVEPVAAPVEQPADAPIVEQPAAPAEPPVVVEPQDAEPDPESMPPPADTPGGVESAPQPDALPPANP